MSSAERYSYIKLQLEELLRDSTLHEEAIKLLWDRDSSEVKGDISEARTAYENVITSVLEAAPQKNPDLENPDLLIKLSRVKKDEFNDEEYIDVSLYSEDEEKSYAVDFTSWGSMAKRYIILGDAMYLTNAEILAEVLWEITFWGFSIEDVQKEKDKLEEALEETREGKCVSFDSVEELFKEISKES